MYKKTVLDNGVRVVTAEMKSRHSLAVGIWLNVGGRFEDPKLLGISHFLEHMVFKGTKKYSCQKIKESIEGVGGSFNGFTAEEATCYLVKIPHRYAELALDILSQMAVYPTFPAGELEKERTVVLEEIKMYKDLPQSYVYELLDELLWPDQPLGRSILGTAETVNSISRRDLVSYRQQHYSGANIVISAAGALAHDKFVRKAAKFLSAVPKSQANPFEKAKLLQPRPGLKVYAKDTEQTHLALGFHSLHRDHPLRFALVMMNIILGGSSSSRLFNEIREKRGLAYEIGSLAKRLRDTGALIVHAGIDTAKAEEALKVIFQELEKMAARPVSRDELHRAKEYFLGQLMISLEDTMDQMLWIGESTLTLDKTLTVKQVVEQVRKVSAADVKKVAGMLFSKEKANLALIGPLAGKEEVFRSILENR